MEIVLRNDYHHTSMIIDIQPPHPTRPVGNGHWTWSAHLTKLQVRRLNRRLCGQSNCRCLGVFGICGLQYMPNGDLLWCYT